MIQDISIKSKNDTTKEKTKEEDIKYFDTTNGEEQVIKTETITVTLTTTQSQKNKTNDKKNNMTILDLGDCEKDLREFYNISDNKLI